MTRTLVRFYNRNIEPLDHPERVPSAVVHHVDCLQSGYHVVLEPGQMADRPDGRWERFDTEDEAREAAEAHDRWRTDRATYIQFAPQCCRHL